MSRDRFNNIWRLMKENRFEFVSSTSDVLCIMCQRVLINAHSGPCGCRYCLECVSEYLSDEGGNEDKMCPGEMDDCREEPLEMERNVRIDQPMNVRVSRLVVKCCVGDGCEHTDELRRMEEHVKECSSRSCRSNSDLRLHLMTDAVEHSRLTIDAIQDLRGRVESLKEGHVELRREIESIKRNDSAADRVSNDFESKYLKEISELKKKLEETQNIFDKEKRNTETKFNEINKFITDSKSVSNRTSESPSNFESETNVLEKNPEEEEGEEEEIFGEFVWSIENWREKTEQARAGINTGMYGDAFYSHKNGYKMCLSVYPNGAGENEGTHLSVFFHLMRGKYDDMLSWPFKHDVTVEMINERATQIHRALTIKYDNDPDYSDVYQKPIADINENGYGLPEFISLEDLSKNRTLTDNDKIFLRCKVKTD